MKNFQDKAFFYTHANLFSLRILFENLAPKPILNQFYRITNPDIADRKAYLPFFLPWRSDRDFISRVDEVRARTLLNTEALWTLYIYTQQCLHVSGDFIEAGVYRGGTAKFLKNLLKNASDKTLHLFDTFSGMPNADEIADFHKAGDFSDTDLSCIAEWVGDEKVCYYPGLMENTLADIQGKTFAFAHIDVDLKSSVETCCKYIYPRMSKGGIMIFDDYGYPTCPGARAAVDNFFCDKVERPLALAHGQAIVMKIS